MVKIKVLHMITHLKVDGAQEYTLLTVKGHSRNRHEVYLAAGLDQTNWLERGAGVRGLLFLLFPVYAVLRNRLRI